MAQDVSLAPPPYDFVRLCHFSRLVQLGCLALQMFLVYSEFSSLSYFQLIFYETLSAASFYLVFSRWHNAVDGRFDLEQLVNARDMQRRVPYIVASFSPLLAAFLIWTFVELENSFIHFFFYITAAVNFFAALGLLVLEVYEVFVFKNKTK